MAAILMPADSLRGLGFLLEAAAKGLAVLLLAWAAAMLLRRGSAALRHAVWTMSIAGLLCLPLLSAALPQLNLPLLPHWTEGQPPTVPAAHAAPEPPWVGGAAEAAPAPAPAEALAPLPPRRPEPIGETPYVPPAPLAPAPVVPPVPAAAPAAAAQPEPSWRLHWSAWVLLAWAAGAAALLLPLLAGTVAVWLKVRKAHRLTGRDWRGLLDSLRRQLGIRGPVALLRTAWSNIPLTCGILRPKILLPHEADRWSPDRRRIVLLHELAHVKRGDCLTQFIARLARAMHWFNPLAWWAGRLLRIERERACDDLVLASGQKPSDYASHLLEIVRTLRSARCPSLAAVPMARRSQFEGRMLAILDPRRSRRSLTRAGTLIAAVLAATFVAPIACMKPTLAGQPAASAGPSATQPSLQGPSTQSADQAAVEDLAGRFLGAVRDDDLEAMKGLSAGSVEGWLDANEQAFKLLGWSPERLTKVAAEIRKDVFAKNPDSAKTVAQCVVDGNFAATRSPGPKGKDDPKYLILVFVRTSGGWRFATLDDAEDPLKDELARHAEFLRKLPRPAAPGPAPEGTSTQPAGKPSIGIYLITGHPQDLPFDKTPLADFTLAAEPLISEGDIFAYDWESHTIRLRQQAVADRVLNRRGLGEAFVVVVDGQRLYRGAMESILSSIVPNVPVIYVGPTASQWQPTFAVRIHPPPLKDAPDPRGDPRLKRALQARLLLPRDDGGGGGATQPALQGATTQPAGAATDDPADIAKRFLVAMRDSEIDKARALSLGSEIGWLPYKQVAQMELKMQPLCGLSQEMVASVARELEQKVKYPGDGPTPGRAVIQDDIAGVPFKVQVDEWYLLVLLKRSEKGWRVITAEGVKGAPEAETARLAKMIRVALAAVATMPATQPGDATVVENIANRFMAAVRDDDLETMKALSLGSVEGWLDSNERSFKVPIGLSLGQLEKVGAEFRKEVLRRMPPGAITIAETAIEGDMAATRSPGPDKAKYILLVLARTAKGWRVATLDDAELPLREDLAKRAQYLEEYRKKLPRPATQRAKIAAARTDIANLEVALSAFEIDVGRYPTAAEGLSALVQQPAAGAQGWRGPYLRNLPNDPWGNPYVYRFPGKHNPDGFDLFSLGPDGKEGTADDLTNWSPPAR